MAVAEAAAVAEAVAEAASRSGYAAMPRRSCALIRQNEKRRTKKDVAVVLGRDFPVPADKLAPSLSLSLSLSLSFINIILIWVSETRDTTWQRSSLNWSHSCIRILRYLRFFPSLVFVFLILC